MPEIDKARAAWKTLRGQWQKTNQEAREARAGCTAAFAACRAGDGGGPTDAQLAEADRLERLADQLSIEMDNLIKNTFG